ncbi:MAG: NTP transferase domain-containing protein [Solirubrobacteraceae bacterium]|jgi:2-phospho-L-lactate guanylyltransferase
MRTAAILPVKSFARAKQRLGGSVADPLRLELARAMVADVLLALARTRSIELTILVTRERSVLKAARELGALAVHDDAEAGQSAAAALGVRTALAEGMERVLCVPGDCPALDPAELEALLDDERSASLTGPYREAPAGRPVSRSRGDGGPAGVIIVPDRHGTGTNGLLISPPDAIRPSFGPGSCQRHRALALAAGIPWRVERPGSLLLDVDTGADLAALRERLSGESARASRTRAVLVQPERPHGLTIKTTA